MSKQLKINGHEISPSSQRILLALENGDWKYSRHLCEPANLDDNGKVAYRMEAHLIPAGLAEEKPRDDENDPRQFKLTEEGQKQVEKYQRELEAPSTREEIAEMAQEGYEAGTSAKKSVQEYRKKVSDIRVQLNDTRDTVGEIEHRQEVKGPTVELIEERSDNNKSRLERVEQEVEDLEESSDSHAEARLVADLQSKLSELKARADRTEYQQAVLARKIAHAEHDRDHLDRFVKPAGALAGVASFGYFLLLSAGVLFWQEQVVSILVGGVAAVLAILYVVGVTLFAWLWETPSFNSLVARISRWSPSI